MKVCECYRTRNKYSGSNITQVGYCIGTKDCEDCSCGGDELKCNFYEYIRERARAHASSTVDVLTYSSATKEVTKETYINPVVLMERLIARSIKEEQELPWWVCQEIYNFHNKGE